MSSTRQKIVWGAFALIFIVGVFMLLSPKGTVYGRVNGHTVDQGAVKSFLGSAKGISDRQAAQILLDKYLTEAIGADLKVTVSSQEVTDAYEALPREDQVNKTVVQQSLRNKIFYSKLQPIAVGHFKGAFIIAHFDQNSAGLRSVGDPTKAASDKQYATDLIKSLSAKVKSGTSFDDAIKTEQSDPNLGTVALPTATHSGAFDTSDPDIERNSVVKTEDVGMALSKLKAGQVSEPFIVRQTATPGGQRTELYWVIVKLDEAKDTPYKSFGDFLDKAKVKYGYKEYR